MLSATLLAPLVVVGFAPLLASAASIPALLPRSSIPQACQFPVGRGNDYGYDDQSSVSGRSTCIGWALGAPTCDWSVQQQIDAVNAFTQQIAKDGLFKTTTVGVWTAGFGIFTSAFPSRDTSYFDRDFEDAQLQSAANNGAGAMTWYYLDNGNLLVLQAAQC